MEGGGKHSEGEDFFGGHMWPRRDFVGRTQRERDFKGLEESNRDGFLGLIQVEEKRRRVSLGVERDVGTDFGREMDFFIRTL